MIEADLVTALTSLVGGRIYPDVAPAATTTPYLTYQQVGGEVIEPFEDDVPALRNARMQINAWATTRSAASALALSVESAMITAASMKARSIGAMTSIYESDINLYGTRQDFRIWAAR